MAQISNNVLAALLLLAIVISAFGLMSMVSVPLFQITGAASSGLGVTNLSITESFSIKMVRNISDFGTSTIPNGVTTWLASNQTNSNATQTVTFYNGSEGNGTDYGLGTHIYPFVIENDGNDNTTCVQITGTAAATFIGGSEPAAPVFQAAASNNMTGSCGGTMATAWTTVSGAAATMCQQLHSDYGIDQIRIHWRLGIPSDASPSVKSNTLTITAQNTC
jgi:hypothetical protein